MSTSTREGDFSSLSGQARAGSGMPGAPGNPYTCTLTRAPIDVNMCTSPGRGDA
jgi:hypothetical protein